MRRHRELTRPWLLGLPIMALLSACAPHPAPPPMGGVPVVPLTVQTQSVNETDEYEATLISRHSVQMQPSVAGQISAIYVRAGDRVHAGSPLMQIDPHVQQAAVAQAQADAAAQQATIAQAQEQVKSIAVQRQSLQSAQVFAQQQFNRYKTLYAQKAGSQQDLQNTTNSLTKTQSDLANNTAQIDAQRAVVASARKNYQRALATIQQQQATLRYYNITAPFAGVVGDIPVRLGGYVLPTTMLLSVTENNPLEINVSLPSDHAFDLREGLPLDVLDNAGTVVAHSRAFFISPRVDTATQTILVKGMLQNPSGKLKADQAVLVRITYDRHPGILVPTSAISHFGGQDFVFIIVDKGGKTTVHQQAIKLGPLQDNLYVVRTGLKRGDRIVAEGTQKLMEGAPVTLVPPGGPGAAKPGASTGAAH